MSASSDNEAPERNDSAEIKNLRDLPEHENIVEHFYDPDDQAVPEKPVREKTPFSLVGNIIFLLTIAILAGISWLVYNSWQPRKRAPCRASAKRTTPRTFPK